MIKTKSSIIIPKALSTQEEEGFFGKESWHWKLYREPSIVVAGISALLLQIAHPAIADGVNKYSHYQKDFFGRAHRTVISMTRIWFGNRAEAIASASRLYHIHSHIKGTYPRLVNGEIINQNYGATEPHLLIWVLATMIVATVEAYEKVRHPLSELEKEAFYQETKISAQLMGIPLSEYPPNWRAFQAYYQKIITGTELKVGITGATIATEIFPAYFPFSTIVKILAAGFLPPPIREAFKLQHRPKRFKLILFITRMLGRITPARLRYAPPYYQALYRLAKASNKQAGYLARIYYWMGKNIKLPLLSSDMNPKQPIK